MLAPERQTPRPRPPAQSRRSPSKGGLLSSESAPPPPYGRDFPFLQEAVDGDTSDPVAATAKMMGIELDDDDMPVTEDDVRHKSKAELTDLFLQAEKIIKAREQELNVAANLGKTLLETNEALKLRHDALLSRLPAMQSPASSAANAKLPRADPWSTDDDVPSPTLARGNSTASSAHGSPVSSRRSSTITPRRTHVRHISASPSALHALSETNAELIAELTRLHNTTDAAQIEGAQRLRKLEREIGGLRAELEATQRTNAELEEKVKEKVDEERKREWEERLRRLRTNGDGHESDASDDKSIRDFAPQGSRVDVWDTVHGTPRPHHIPPSQSTDSEQGQSDSDAPASISASSTTSSRPISQYKASSSEFAVVAQLYRKVIELQQANSELKTRNRVTSRELAHAEREALKIQRLYDEIGQEFSAEESEQDAPSASTVRGGPCEARRVSVMSNSWSFHVNKDSYLNNKRVVKKGSYGSLGNKALPTGIRSMKSRAPLTDSLFSPPVGTSTKRTENAPPSVVLFPSSPRSRPRLKVKSKDKAKPSPLISPVDTLGFRRDISNNSEKSVSSHASSLLGSSLTHYARRNHGRRSLGSELGSEFGDDWGNMPSSHSTLFDDGSVRAPSEVDPETETEIGGFDNIDDEEMDPALAALRDALTPPLAGRLLEQDEHILPVGSLQASPGEAFHLVAHAVSARPTRWIGVDNRRVRGAAFTQAPAGEDPWETTRYPDIAPGTEPDEGERASVRMRRRDRALGRLTSAAHARSVSSGEAVSSSQVQTASPPRGIVESIKRASVDMFVELWIFLQFVVVVCIFLYTMGRRGPRQVLGAPPRRA